MKLLNSYETIQASGQFFYACLGTMLWSSVYLGNDENDELEQLGSHLDAVFCFEDLEQDSADKLKALCDKFIELAGESILEHNYEQAGHDFWLTIAGHGAGFWDGDWPINGDKLTKLCKGLVPHIETYNTDTQVYISI